MLERILLRDVRPPATVRQAIEAKQQADQEAQRMVYVLQKERQEADRKRIEAQGIADFQKIVTQGIQRATPGMERNRGHGDAGEKPQHESHRDREYSKRIAADSRTRESAIAQLPLLRPRIRLEG